MSTSPLFREAAQNAQRPTPYGRILLIQPPSFAILTAMSVAFGAAIALFFAFGSYTRHSTVNGQLLPDAGLIKLYAPRQGVVLERHVQENQQVAPGDVLFVISGEHPLGAEGNGLGSELGAARAAGERTLLVSKVAELRRQLDLLDQQMETQKNRVALSQEAVNTYRDLLEKRYVSAEQLQQKREDLLDQQARMQGLQRERVALTHELGAQYMVVTATQAGTATAVTADVGQTVDSQKPLLSIVPAGSALHAELLAPSRSVGFIRAGDRVLLRYQAYPYQKFGHYSGIVSSVSDAAVAPAELAAYGQNQQNGEPLYQIRVKLDAQSVQAYGRQQPLRSGMTVEADVLQERRRLYEWVLDPLFSLSGRV